MATAVRDHVYTDDEKKLGLPEHDPIAAEVIEELENAPTEEERLTLRRVPGSLPVVAYLICAVEFAERSSYYGVQQLITNYVNRPLPEGGNGYGAPPRNSEKTGGALGLGLAKASAVAQSFSMLCYVLPILFGWLADKYFGRFKLICYGVGVFGVAHVLLMAATAPNLLATGATIAPFMLSVYILAVGSAIFKPNISPLLLDQMRNREAEVTTLKKTGERVIVDPEHTTERVMLWFYLLINIGGFMGVATGYSEKYVGWWLAFLLPLLLYLPLPFLLWYLYKRLVLYPPGGSDLGNVFRVLGCALSRAGIKGFGRAGFWDNAKPSVIAKSSNPIQVTWTDDFVNDVRRTFQATGIFCFFPIQYINDNGLGQAAGGLSTALRTNGVPNDVIQNFNTLSIIVCAPLLNYGLYPLLRKWKINFPPIARITFGLFLSTLGGVAYCVLQYYAYLRSPCGYNATNGDICEDTADISIWWMAIPYGLGGISELFVNVPAYGIAYARAPKNLRGLVSAINLLSTGVAYAIGLACSSVVQDPYLTWDFGGPAIAGGVLTVVFYFLFRHLDTEEFQLAKNDDYESKMQQHAADEHIPPTERQPSVVAAVMEEKHPELATARRTSS